MTPAEDPKAELPPELAGKRGPGRPPGAKNKPVAVEDEAIVRAWLGIWAALRALTWVLGGVLARKGERYELGALTSAEAKADAQSLRPILESHPALLVALAFVGAPVALILRVKEKLERVKVSEAPKPEVKDGEAPKQST